MIVYAAHLKPGDVCYLPGDEFGDDAADRAVVCRVNENAMLYGVASVEFDFGQVDYPAAHEIEVIQPTPEFNQPYLPEYAILRRTRGAGCIVSIANGTEYKTTIEGVYISHKGKMIDLLRGVRDACRAEGMRADDYPYDMTGDEYKWSLRVWRPIDGDPARETGNPRDLVPPPDRANDEDCIDVTVEIAEAATYGDDEVHGGFGINFGLDIVEWGGRILGGLCPNNYTDECWVDARDAEAVATRWAILAGADMSEIPTLINPDEEGN